MRSYLTATLLALAALMLGFAAPSIAQTLPKIVSDAYKVDGAEPDACSCGAPNAPALTCSLPSVTGGVRPTCDVSPIIVSGTYNVTITVTRKEKITNTAGGGQLVPASEATSGPFAYTLVDVALPPPTGARLTTQ
jgi:hypothetical protein